MAKSNKSPVLDAIVERVLPFGVFVRLQDGTRGYIRRRDLDLDADVEPSKITREGERLKVAALGESEPGKAIQLSRRATLVDPWPKFFQDHRVGDVVRGSVRAIHPQGIFVRIQPGVDGFVPLEKALPIRTDRPDAFFWIGDNVEAVIIQSYPKSKHLGLSIKARMRQYDQALEASGSVSRRPSIKLGRKRYAHNETTPIRLSVDVCEKVGPILVVEDDDYVRESLTTWLSRKGFNVSSAEDVSTALSLNTGAFKVFIVDLNLYENDGLELIRHIRTENERSQVCIMSSPEILDRRVREIESAEVVDVFPKPLDLEDIEAFLLRIANNQSILFWKADRQVPDTLAKAATVQFSETSTLIHLQQALSDVTFAIKAQIGLLFQLDPDTHVISIPIRAGKGQLNPSAIYGLRESPIKDVMKEGVPVFENRVLEKLSPRFDKLLNLLAFKSCIGVPIHVQGEVHHAAFFFHPDLDAFPVSRLRDVQAGTLLLSAILTEESIQARLRSLNPLLLSGELAASFGHDVFNKITALELEALNLADVQEIDYAQRANKLLELVLDLKETTYAFQQMLRTKGTIENIDGNAIIQRTVLLLRDLARKERTKVILKLLSDSPALMGNSVMLQQTFLNIMLNAIQQMAQKSENLKWTGRRSLEITSCIKNSFFQVRFKDNGPGIHRESLRKIFLPGFSTRGGSGLGLYIARSFVQMLGGTLQVEETLIPLGTTFLVELPITNQEKGL